MFITILLSSLFENHIPFGNIYFNLFFCFSLSKNTCFTTLLLQLAPYFKGNQNGPKIGLHLILLKPVSVTPKLEFLIQTKVLFKKHECGSDRQAWISAFCQLKNTNKTKVSIFECTPVPCVFLQENLAFIRG